MYKIRSVRTSVLPLPGPAMTSQGPGPQQTASRWEGLRSGIIDGTQASSFAIAARILAMDSSLPRISMISVAPAGVVIFPDTAIRTGQST